MDVFLEVQGQGPVDGQVEVKLANTTVDTSMAVTLTAQNSTVSFDISIPEVG